MTVLIMLLGAFLWLQQGSWSEARQQYQEQVSLNERLKSELAILRGRAELADQTELTKADLVVLDVKLSNATSQTDLIGEASRLARRSNVSILHSDNQLEAVEEGVFWFHQELTVEGSYSELRYFFQLLATGEYLNFVEELDWKPSRADQQKVIVKIGTLFGDRSE